MKLFTCILILVYGVSSFDYERLSSISRAQVLNVAAATCSEESWKGFSREVRLGHLLSRAEYVPASGLQFSVDRVLDPAKKLSLTFSGSGISVVLGTKKFLATDLCDLAIKGGALDETAAHPWRALLPTAFAAGGLIEEDRASDYLLATATTAVVIGAAVTLNEAAAVSLGLGGLYWRYFTTGNPIVAKDNFEKIINQPFKLFCSKNMVMVQGNGRRIELTKQPPQVQILKTSGEVETNDSGTRNSEGRKFMADIARRCATPADSEKVLFEIEQKRGAIKARLESLKSDAGAAKLAPAGTR